LKRDFEVLIGQKYIENLILLHCFFHNGYEAITHITHKFDEQLYKRLPNLYAVWMADNNPGEDKRLVAGFLFKTNCTYKDPEFHDVLHRIVESYPNLSARLNRRSSFLPTRLGVLGEAPLSEEEMLSALLGRFTAFRARQEHESKINVLLNAPTNYLLQAVVVPGEETEEGQIIEAVTLPWFKLIDLLIDDPNVVYQLDWRKWEEIIAGAYAQKGFDVVLTPRSGDKGRDVIATSRGFGCVRYFEQVKAYSPGRLVTADDVRAMLGVLTAEGNVSKGIVTTTSNFAPGILADENIKRFMPYRLELKPREKLLEWLRATAHP
jgi:restriction system protein